MDQAVWDTNSFTRHKRSRLEEAVIQLSRGECPKLPRKLKKRAKRAALRVVELKNKLYDSMRHLEGWPASDALREVDRQLQSLKMTESVDNIEVCGPDESGVYSFKYSMRLVQPACVTSLTIKKPGSMSDVEFEQFAKDLSSEINATL